MCPCEEDSEMLSSSDLELASSSKSAFGTPGKSSFKDVDEVIPAVDLNAGSPAAFSLRDGRTSLEDQACLLGFTPSVSRDGPCSKSSDLLLDCDLAEAFRPLVKTARASNVQEALLLDFVSCTDLATSIGGKTSKVEGTGAEGLAGRMGSEDGLPPPSAR
mmetsp:Transcript_74697/g.222774  ORF Transcript_74697/g.222774 Transcript_74697/m.222774 type:complete len:160 (+) Transcript_74697:213-692(+)